MLLTLTLSMTVQREGSKACWLGSLHFNCSSRLLKSSITFELLTHKLSGVYCDPPPCSADLRRFLPPPPTLVDPSPWLRVRLEGAAGVGFRNGANVAAPWETCLLESGWCPARLGGGQRREYWWATPPDKGQLVAPSMPTSKIGESA